MGNTKLVWSDEFDRWIARKFEMDYDIGTNNDGEMGNLSIIHHRMIM